jgi:molybdopterin/thiamine biosynthesis adenylyltransferase
LIDATQRNEVKAADVLAGCVDNHGTRLSLNHLSLRYLIPLVDAGTGIRISPDGARMDAGGQVQTVVPGGGCLECRGLIDARRASFDLASPEEQEYERRHGYGTEDPAPSVIHLNGVVGSLMVAEIIRLICGDGNHRRGESMAVFDAVNMRMFSAKSPGRTDCVSCGDQGAIGVGDLAPLRRATTSALLTSQLLGESHA